MDSSSRRRVIRDPVYGYITVPKSLVGLVDHPISQRLRRISQNSRATSVYPSMTGTRFEHALGTMHLAQLAWTAIWENSDKDAQDFLINGVDQDGITVEESEFQQTMSDAIACLAFLHDVGHPPFSHALEPFYRDNVAFIMPGFGAARKVYGGSQFHEVVGHQLVEELVTSPSVKISDPLRTIILRMNQSKKHEDGSWTAALYGLLDSEIDVDRLDYLMRDAHRAGTEFGSIDYARLVDSMRLKVWQSSSSDGTPPKMQAAIMLSFRGKGAAETLLVQRVQAYRWILFHPRVVAADLFLLRGLQMMMELEDPNGENGVREEIRNLYKSIRPNLDYVTSGQSFTMDEYFGPAAKLIPTREKGITAGIQGKGSESIGSEHRQTLDDSAILEWLKRGSLLAQAMLAEGVLGGNECDYAKRLVAYYSACINRSRNFSIGWKSYEDYKKVAEELRAGLLPIIETAWTEIAAEVAKAGMTSHADYVHIRESVKDIRKDGSSVQLLNHVAEFVVGSSGYAAPKELNVMDEKNRGFWELAYRPFKAIKQDELTYLLDDQGELTALKDASPLVDTLTSVAEERIKLFTYFISVSNSESGVDSVQIDADTVRLTFLRNFPELTKRRYAKAVLESVLPATERD